MDSDDDDQPEDFDFREEIEEYEEDDLGEYKSPEEGFYYGEEGEEEFVIESGSRIDTGAEWRDYGDGVSKSRVGMAREMDIDEDLGTMMVDEKFKRMEMMSRTPMDMFRILARKIKEKYNISESVYTDSLRIAQNIEAENRGLKFKNPSAILFALLCMENKVIKAKNVEVIYEEMAKHEKMNKTDLLRYIFFVQEMFKK